MRYRIEDPPDHTYPSDNVFGIPELNLRYCATGLNLPAYRWGRLNLSKVKNARTIHFYTDDYKFSALWQYPQYLLNTKATTIIEPNFSLDDLSPYAVALWRTYQKRWLSRYWQQHGIKVIVDLNVPEIHSETNLHGVPYGWRAYAARGYNGNNDESLLAKYALAVERAGTEDILFLVYGGGNFVKQLCLREKWNWIAEDSKRLSRFRKKDHVGIWEIRREELESPLSEPKKSLRLSELKASTNP